MNPLVIASSLLLGGVLIWARERRKRRLSQPSPPTRPQPKPEASTPTLAEAAREWASQGGVSIYPFLGGVEGGSPDSLAQVHSGLLEECAWKGKLEPCLHYPGEPNQLSTWNVPCDQDRSIRLLFLLSRVDALADGTEVPYASLMVFARGKNMPGYRFVYQQHVRFQGSDQPVKQIIKELTRALITQYKLGKIKPPLKRLAEIREKEAARSKANPGGE